MFCFPVACISTTYIWACCPSYHRCFNCWEVLIRFICSHWKFLMLKVIAIFVFSPHRCWGPSSSESTGGKCTLQGFTVTYINTLPSLFFTVTVNTLLINTECLSPMLLVSLFVFPADRRVRFRFLICSLLALISDVHTASVIGILFTQVALNKAAGTEWMDGTQYMLYCLTCCFHWWVCEFVSEEDQRRHCAAVSQHWQTDEKSCLIKQQSLFSPFSSCAVCQCLRLDFPLSDVSSESCKASEILYNTAFCCIMRFAWQQDGSIVCQLCLQGVTIGGIEGITYCSQWEDPITTYVDCLSFSHAI